MSRVRGPRRTEEVLLGGIAEDRFAGCHGRDHGVTASTIGGGVKPSSVDGSTPVGNNGSHRGCRRAPADFKYANNRIAATAMAMVQERIHREGGGGGDERARRDIFGVASSRAPTQSSFNSTQGSKIGWLRVCGGRFNNESHEVTDDLVEDYRRNQ